MQTLKNKKRPFRPIALSIYRAAIKNDQSANDSQAERLARAGLAPATSKKSPPKGWRAGLVGGLRSNKPSRTYEPKAKTPRTKSERGGRERGARSEAADWPKKVVNIEPVIRPSTLPPTAAHTPQGGGGGGWLY